MSHNLYIGDEIVESVSYVIVVVGLGGHIV